IHQEIKETRYDLTTARDTTDILQRESLLDESISTADNILVRADSVISAMYGFVGILQFEDRLSQILDGMVRVLNNCSANILELGFSLDGAKEKELRDLVVNFYTVQEQRDFALGLEVKPRYCDAPSIDDDGPLFF
ncbi:MAG: hypothetical protein RL154_345, partial [Pseudomonadota bacterium]